MRIDGASVALRDLEPDDAERLVSLQDASRPWHLTNGPYFGLPTPEEADAQARALAVVADTPEAELPTPRDQLGIVCRADGALVGLVSWYWESRETDWRRMGIGIHDEAYWGRGLASEALALWTTYLFGATDALRLDFATYSGNPGMLAVGRRLGFVEEARFRAARRWSGGVHDSVVMGVLRSEWRLPEL